MVTAVLALLTTIGALNLFASIASFVVSRPLTRPAPHGLSASLLCTQDEQPFVSIHVAVHDEPAALVVATLNALAASEYDAFEVIVIDNNTPDPATWQSVRDHVASLDERFHFHHFDGVQGAKAGALNIALELTDPRTRYVGVVDADYQVTPDFIATAVASCGPTVQFVQFPQAYRSADRAGAVVAELSDYFATFPSAANREQASLLTGTLSMISIDALRRVGGWPTRSITEDAELGLALWSSGARGLFIDREVGHGLLPMDLAGLRLQRRRWVTGNAQTLLGGWSALRRAPGGISAVLAQLTAWVGFLAVPLITLLVVACARAWPLLGNAAPALAWRTVEVLSVATFFCVLVGQLVRAMSRERIGSIAVTAALLWTSSFAWFDAFGVRAPKFRRTPKTVDRRRPKPSIDTLGSLTALSAASAFIAEGSILTAAVLMLSAAGLITGPFVDRSLRRAAAGL